MSRRNIADETFGDISGFEAWKRNYEVPVETESGEGIELSHSRVSRDEAIAEISSSDIESTIGNWSGPESLSENDIWGESEYSEAGHNTDETLAGAIPEGEHIPEIDGIFDPGNPSVERNSSRCKDTCSESFRSDENFDENNLVNDIDEEVDSNQAHENITDASRSLVDDNIKDPEINSMNESIRDIDSNLADNNVEHTDNNSVDESIQDSGSHFGDEFVRDADNSLVGDKVTVEREDPVDGSASDIDQKSIEDNHSEDESVPDEDSCTADENHPDPKGFSRRKKQKEKKNVDDKSNIVLPSEDSNPSASVENAEDIAVNINDGELNIRDEDNIGEWTVLEVWSCFAMVSGVLPYRIYNDGTRTKLQRNLLSKTLWAVSVIFYIIEFANVIPKMSVEFVGKPSGKKLSFIAMHFSHAIFLCTNILTSLLKEQYLIKANNQLLSLPHGRLSVKKAGAIFVLLFSIAILNTCSYILYQTKTQSGFVILDTEEIMETLECLGKMPLSLSRECTPSDFLSITNIIWSLTGFIITAHEIFLETVISLGILISCGTLLYATFDIEDAEDHQMEIDLARGAEADLSNLNNMAEELSKFIGEILTAYLIFNATVSATVLLDVFEGGIVVVVSGIINNGIVLMGLFLASVAAQRINWIVDKLSAHQIPLTQQGRPGTAMIINFFRDMAFRKSTGIGFAGIYVITFKTTFSYIGAIGALIALKL